ncbi:hypothetical protein RFI_08636 [Reticulomyxa filosa]|uniref:Uncharacterized protein n=1 Tax=Reticulomyxa filosa TaxID=46433 RepID=X6NRE4_RETFI|nr:hypothetical protein RFI_08636 [Reticulomyxa filosa]|eukprot:ETO28493.1 hypothetical protein RFI_08636 [Reticulomyxa filosa]
MVPSEVLMSSGANKLTPSSRLLSFPTKELTAVTKRLTQCKNIWDVCNHVANSSSCRHKAVWQAIGQHALGILDLDAAELAFVECKNYGGIQFVKKLRNISTVYKRKAEVCIYFGQFDEAENIYLKNNEKSLALQLRMSLGDWPRVMEMAQSGAGDDKTLQKAYKHIGDYWKERQVYQEAIKYYMRAKEFQSLAHCAFRVFDFATLYHIVKQLPDGTPLLKLLKPVHFYKNLYVHQRKIGEMFENFGQCEKAAEAYCKFGDIKCAIQCCITWNEVSICIFSKIFTIKLEQWGTAAKIGRVHDYKEVQSWIEKRVNTLLSQNKIFEAANVYHQSEMHLACARLLTREALKLSQLDNTHVTTMTPLAIEPLKIKKLYVLSALEIDKHRKAMMKSHMANNHTAMDTIDQMLAEDQQISPEEQAIINSAWHGAEAYHFYLLAQKQIHKMKWIDALQTVE